MERFIKGWAEQCNMDIETKPSFESILTSAIILRVRYAALSELEFKAMDSAQNLESLGEHFSLGIEYLSRAEKLADYARKWFGDSRIKECYKYIIEELSTKNFKYGDKNTNESFLRGNRNE